MAWGTGDSRNQTDVGVLCAELGIEPGRYRTFRRSRVEDSLSAAGKGVPTEARRAALGQAAPAPAVLPGAWSALEAALPRKTPGAVAPAPDALRVQRIGVTLFPVVGGVGVTTLVATLGRLLASAGRRVALAEPPGQSLLRFYFTDGAAELPKILAGESGDDWLREVLAQAREDLDLVLIDAGAGLPDEARSVCVQAAIRIVVLTPDLRSVVRLAPLVESIRQEGTAGRSPRPVYLLLNQYDPAVDLHREILERLEQQYEGWVSPVSIRRSDLIGTALANGRTVVDDAPGSEVAGDYRLLSDWLTTITP